MFSRQGSRSRESLPIKDDNQPLLISKAKDKQLRGGRDQLVWLVPEFCIITGLDEQQRKNME